MPLTVRRHKLLTNLSTIFSETYYITEKLGELSKKSKNNGCYDGPKQGLLKTKELVCAGAKSM